MWRMKDLKGNAKQVLKRNYIGIVITCVIAMIVMGNFVNPIDAFEDVKDRYFEELNNTALFDENSDSGLSKVDFADNAKQDSVDDDKIVSDFMGEVGVNDKNAQKWTNGVLAMVINNTDDTDSLVYGILNSVNQIAFNAKFTNGILIAIGTLIYFLISVFFTNVIRVGYSRYLLENRAYGKTKLNRIMFAWSVKKDLNVAWVMFVKRLYFFLWCFTGVGGIIKLYSYRLVPLILAENPTLTAKEAITLSRRMMDGHKWKTF